MVRAALLFLCGLVCGVTLDQFFANGPLGQGVRAKAYGVLGLNHAPQVDPSVSESVDYGPPLATMIDVNVERTVAANAVFLPEALILVTNRSGDYVTAYVTCAFLDKAGAASSNGTAIVSNIAPSGSARADVRSSAQYSRPARAECRVESARFAR